ncbi:hypothetical protein ACFL27_05485 [candidate division CSSED10-310 bacterium]|uniref:Uncharacterized protein n=1 Tax=candidate division CSSED10-310 bacterium TaxID=2855610 RepID=A0ABV6YTY5_UNCC1
MSFPRRQCCSIFFVITGLFLLGYASALPAEEEEYLSFIKRKIPLSSLITFPEGEGNAADLYWLALKDYHAPHVNNALVRGEREVKDPAAITWQSPEVEIIERATAIGLCHFSPTYWPYASKFNDPVPSWICLQKQAAALKEKGDIQQGKAFNESNPVRKFRLKLDSFRTYEKIIIFGHHIENERLSLTQVHMGALIIDIGLKSMQNFFKNTGDDENLKLVQVMINDNNSYMERIEQKSKSLVSSFNPRDTEPIIVNWDNIFSVAREDEDTMFRLEAICILSAALHAFWPLAELDPALPEKFVGQPDKSMVKDIIAVLAELDMFDTDPLIQDAARRGLSPVEVGVMKKVQKEYALKKKLPLQKKESPWLPPLTF